MDFEEIGTENAYRILAPRPTIIVTTINKKGEVNAAPFSFTMPVSMNPPLIAFASVTSHDTYKNIAEVDEFVVNIPNENILKELWITGEKFPYGINEIEKANLTPKSSKKVSPPGIDECVACIECKVHWIKKAGDHDIIVGEVLDVSIQSDSLKEGLLDVKKVKPILHLGGMNFVVGDHLKKVE
ncbi:MAG: flavin reductase family protein [Methanobacterium sp.]|uniref:flavin reductase family protein n=1 Tax=Methanobacterium sp. TaxID=2164 RepID=UPI003D656FC7|nr:flavin reductase family protein [Methanobacterium sp.]